MREKQERKGEGAQKAGAMSLQRTGTVSFKRGFKGKRFMSSSRCGREMERRGWEF